MSNKYLTEIDGNLLGLESREVLTIKDSNAYNKPSTGIPKSDLSSDVQSSLGKADTALQTHQDISGKQDKLTAGTNITISDDNVISAEGGSGNTETLTLEEYVALSDEEKMNGTYYYVIGDNGTEMPVVVLTKAQYDALGDVTINDGIIYIITDQNYALDSDNIKYGSTTVSQALANLSSQISDKVSVSTYNSGMSGKVDTSTYNSGMSGKADASSFNSLKNLVNYFIQDDGEIPAYDGNLDNISINSIVNGANNANAPIQGDWGFIITFYYHYSHTYASQIWIGMTTAEMYMRIKCSGNWYSWNQINMDALLELE